MSCGGHPAVAGAGEVVGAGDSAGDRACPAEAGHLHTQLHGARRRALRDASGRISGRRLGSAGSPGALGPNPGARTQECRSDAESIHFTHAVSHTLEHFCTGFHASEVGQTQLLFKIVYFFRFLRVAYRCGSDDAASALGDGYITASGPGSYLLRRGSPCQRERRRVIRRLLQRYTLVFSVRYP